MTPAQHVKRIGNTVTRLERDRLARNLAIVEARDAGLSYNQLARASGLSKPTVMLIVRQGDEVAS